MWTVENLKDGLHSLGVYPGVVLMVHASLRKIGTTKDGAQTVVDALTHAVGKDGTIVMPLGSMEGVPFDPLTTPADQDVGWLPEIFRKGEDVCVSDHPAARFAGWGSKASFLLQDPPWHDYYGDQSLLQRFVQENGKVLRMGADGNTVTLTHYAEYKAQVTNKKRVRRLYELADGSRHFVESLDDMNGIRPWADGDYFKSIWESFANTDFVRKGFVGHAPSELFCALPYVEFSVRWLEETFSE